jgi:hypothetical protein
MAPFVGDGDLTLPKSPDVEFSLLAPRPGEASLVTELREILAEELR